MIETLPQWELAWVMCTLVACHWLKSFKMGNFPRVAKGLSKLFCPPLSTSAWFEILGIDMLSAAEAATTILSELLNLLEGPRDMVTYLLLMKFEYVSKE
jgi:hypothetical protein